MFVMTILLQRHLGNSGGLHLPGTSGIILLPHHLLAVVVITMMIDAGLRSPWSTEIDTNSPFPRLTIEAATHLRQTHPTVDMVGHLQGHPRLRFMTDMTDGLVNGTCPHTLRTEDRGPRLEFAKNLRDLHP
jgi:hypothetical protein